MAVSVFDLFKLGLSPSVTPWIIRWSAVLVPVLAALALAACTPTEKNGSSPTYSIPEPLVDHHTHLIGPDAMAFLANVGAVPKDANPFDAEQLIGAMDAAGVNRAAVAGVGYFFASALLPAPLENERSLLRQENDWNASQAGRHPERLVSFCGVNPLRNYVVDEIAHCADSPTTVGVKMHFANSGVDIYDASHVRQVVDAFQAAQRHHLAVLVHVWVPAEHYGSEHARIFIEEILAAVPDLVVQIAHLAGSGPGYDADAAFRVFAEAAHSKDPRVANVWHDVASSVVVDASVSELELIAQRLRTVGLDRILFGTDYAGVMNLPPEKAWNAFLQLPLTSEEFLSIARNKAPYFEHGNKR